MQHFRKDLTKILVDINRVIGECLQFLWFAFFYPNTFCTSFVLKKLYLASIHAKLGKILLIADLLKKGQRWQNVPPYIKEIKKNCHDRRKRKRKGRGVSKGYKGERERIAKKYRAEGEDMAREKP
ncbi:MAG: hypothetical protein IBX72_09840 [Nitrospirae bacterium]|jgi:hypothetical protein|nr:hypothetical protein [Nitrospirota bacterium]